MNILINNNEAVLKKGITFDFVTENKFFTGADSYTLSITFPLKGCIQNQRIFGWLNRKDCDMDTVLMECEIHDGKFHHYGSINIVDINEKEVKTQFLEGRSIVNYYSSLDDVYINQLDYDSPIFTADIDPAFCLWPYSYHNNDSYHVSHRWFVPLPWVNNTSGNIQNKMIRNGKGNLEWETEGQTLVGFPYLMYVLKTVLDAVEYTYDLSALENSQFADLIICNALPSTWNMTHLGMVLPDWTVTEFLEQIELFTAGHFTIDTSAKTASFSFDSDRLDNLPVVELDNIVDTFKVEISDESKSSSKNGYMENQNLAYSDCDHNMWKFYSCPWMLNKMGMVTWNTLSDMTNALDPIRVCDGEPNSNIYYNCVHYVKDYDMYFVLRCYHIGSDNKHYMRYQMVNTFGPRFVDSNGKVSSVYGSCGNADSEKTELDIVPAWIDYADSSNGDLPFIECGKYGNADDDNDEQTLAVNVLDGGEDDSKTSYFDKLYVAFWDGDVDNHSPYLPRPFINDIEFGHGGAMYTCSYGMRLKGTKTRNIRRMVRYVVDQDKKYTFQFLAEEIPDVQSIFIIHGKKYLAEKITASFSEDGMSRLMKIVCYRISSENLTKSSEELTDEDKGWGVIEQ